MEHAILSIRDLRVVFEDGFVALGGVSIDIGKNEFVTLLGPSGCGKTTLLRCIGGFEKPTSGEILYKGQNIIPLPPYKRAINTVFQRYALFPHLNVAQNVAFGPDLRGEDKKKTAAEVTRMLELVGLSGFERRKIGSLSGGQQQRVAIARALINKPDVLLLDEPLAALDLKLRREMQLELKRLQKKLGITFIYITHDQEEAVNMSDRIAVMNGGRFEQVGTPEEIYDRPATRFVAKFIGRSTLLTGTVRTADADSAVIENESGSFTVGLAHAAVKVGERCEICVRTERMRAGRAPIAGFDLPATVREARYAGGCVLTYAVLRDGTEVVAEGTERMCDAPQPGDTVYMHWNPEQAAVIGGASHGA